MLNKIGDSKLTKALADEEATVALPKNHTTHVMQRIDMAKVFKDLLDLEIAAPTEVVKSFIEEKKED